MVHEVKAWSSAGGTTEVTRPETQALSVNQAIDTGWATKVALEEGAAEPSDILCFPPTAGELLCSVPHVPAVLSCLTSAESLWTGTSEMTLK